jgi:hypothetical protein
MEMDHLTSVPPIVLVERGGYQGMYGSIVELLEDVEAIDVMNGEYTVYDAKGRLIALSADSPVAKVSASPTADLRPHDLDRILARAAENIGSVRLRVVDADLRSAELLAAIWRFEHEPRPFPGDGA